MNYLEIEKVIGREIMDSRGNPTVEAEVTLADGTAHPGATGLGSRPTVNDDARDVTCETFLPGFSGDVYGETARLVLCRYLWPTRKFETVDALRQMVQQAAAAALENWQGT